MRLPRSGNFYFTIFFFFFISAMVVLAFSYNKKAAFVPLVIGIPTVILILLELFRDRSPKIAALLETDVFETGKLQHPQKEAVQTAETKYKELYAILAVMGMLGLILLAGFLISIPVFVFCYILFFAREPWWKGLLLSAGTWVFVYLVFCELMEIQFPWSYLF